MAPKEILFHTGELGTDLYIVYSGNVSAIGGVHESASSPVSSREHSSVSRTGSSRNSKSDSKNKDGATRRIGRSIFTLENDLPDDKEQYIVKFKKGDFFGELGMVMGIPRTATVIADETSLLLTLRKTEFTTFLKAANINFDHLMRSRSLEHMRNCYRLSFFNALPEGKFEILADNFSIAQWEPGKVLYKQGESAERMYLIAYGTVSVEEVGTEREWKSKGDILGAVDVLHDRPGKPNSGYSHHATAIDRTITLSISKKSLTECFKSQNATCRVDWDLKVLKENCKICHILHHPVAMSFFTESAMKEHNSEMLEFWCQVRGFYEYFQPPKVRAHHIRYPPYAKSVYELDSKLNETSLATEGISAADMGLMKEIADFIWKKFLEDDSVLGMSVRDKSRQYVNKRRKADKYSYYMFTQTQNDIENVLSVNSYMRFRSSPKFKEMLVSMESFSPYTQKKWDVVAVGLDLCLGKYSMERVDRLIAAKRPPGPESGGEGKENPPKEDKTPKVSQVEGKTREADRLSCEPLRNEAKRANSEDLPQMSITITDASGIESNPQVGADASAGESLKSKSDAKLQKL